MNDWIITNRASGWGEGEATLTLNLTPKTTTTPPPTLTNILTSHTHTHPDTVEPRARRSSSDSGSSHSRFCWSRVTPRTFFLTPRHLATGQFNYPSLGRRRFNPIGDPNPRVGRSPIELLHQLFNSLCLKPTPLKKITFFKKSSRKKKQ